MSDPVFGLADGVKTYAINARETSGKVTDCDAQIMEALSDCALEGGVPIIHSVFGSKTGICHEYQHEYEDQVRKLNGLFVVDACQGRFEKEMLHELMDKEAIVLITGSKFFRGPPFSGGVFVPKTIMDKLRSLKDNNQVPYGLNTFIGKNEIPRDLPLWRNDLADNQNPGLALRWVAALAEMEETLKFSS